MVTNSAFITGLPVVIGSVAALIVLSVRRGALPFVHKTVAVLIGSLVAGALVLGTYGQWIEFRFFIPPEKAEEYLMGGNTGVWALYMVMGAIILLYLWLGLVLTHVGFLVLSSISKRVHANLKH